VRRQALLAASAVVAVIAAVVAVRARTGRPRRAAPPLSRIECPRGREGCACSVFGACDQGRCVNGLCESASCTPGTSRCPCLPGHQCRTGACRQGVCIAPGDPLARRYKYSPASEGEVERVHALILARGGFAPGMHVADVGAGRGLLTFPIARIVGPTGRVYATDIDDGAIARLREEAARPRPGAAPIDVRRVTDPYATALDDVPAGSLHRMLMVNVFGLTASSPRPRVLPQLRAFARLLRDDGELLYHQDWLYAELDVPGVTALFAEAGLELRGEIDLAAARMPPQAEVFELGFDEPPRVIRRGYLLRFAPRR
jgi:SAM-dependent methyltransferase